MQSNLSPDRSAAQPGGTKSEARRTDLDALRILTCAAIVLVHAALIFGAEPTYLLKSATPSWGATMLFDLVRPTSVALFFVISGWSAVASLRRRSPGQFALERVKRLLVPLMAGIVLFGPIIKYIELSQGIDIGLHGFRQVAPIDEDFFNFLPHYPRRIHLLTWSHLWFLAYLFLYSVLLLPLLGRLARCAPRITEPTALAVYLPALPMTMLLLASHGYWPILPNLITDWPNFFYYALCFGIGAGISVWPGFEGRLAKETPRLLVFMLLSFAGMAYCGESAAGRLFVGLSTWGGIGAALGFASRFKPVATPVVAYLAEATMPVYIVHYVPLLLLGVLVLPTELPLWLKMVSIWIAAGAISLAAYHWLIRPWPAALWAMGMGGRGARVAATPAGRPAFLRQLSYRRNIAS
jgi:peptidoglycan/LPS O-acetylase OafA/YrhL